MDLPTALIFFGLVVLLFFLLFRTLRIRVFSALVLSLLFGYLVLITVYPWQTLEGFTQGNLCVLLYLLINFLIPVLLFAYILVKALGDREPYREIYRNVC